MSAYLIVVPGGPDDERDEPELIGPFPSEQAASEWGRGNLGEPFWTTDTDKARPPAASGQDGARFWIIDYALRDEPCLPEPASCRGGDGPYLIPIVDDEYGGVVAWANTTDQAERIVAALTASVTTGA